LSACKTAVGGVDLLDEAITLAAALHYTGYRNVVAAREPVAEVGDRAELLEDPTGGVELNPRRVLVAERAARQADRSRAMRDWMAKCYCAR
jgi:hypothetical protein